MLWHRHRDDPADQAVVDVETSPRSAVQLVAAVIGVTAIVLGFYVLLRVGLNTNDLSQPSVTVLRIRHTQLLALSEIGFGVVMILAAMTPLIGRVATGLLSAALAAFGAALLSAARTTRLHHWFGVVSHQGWSFVAIGTVGLLATLAFPPVTRRTVVRPALTEAPQGAELGELDAPNLDAPNLDAPMPDYLHFCLSGCGSTFDTRDAAAGDIRFCGLGHAQRRHGNDWELIPVDTDHGGLHTRVAAYQ